MFKFKAHSKICLYKPVEIFHPTAENMQPSANVGITPMWENDAKRVAACVEVREINTSSRPVRLTLAVRNW